MRESNEGMFIPGGVRRKDTCEQGLSRTPLRAKPTTTMVELESKSDDTKQSQTVGSTPTTPISSLL